MYVSIKQLRNSKVWPEYVQHSLKKFTSSPIFLHPVSHILYTYCQLSHRDFRYVKNSTESKILFYLIKNAIKIKIEIDFYFGRGIKFK